MFLLILLSYKICTLFFFFFLKCKFTVHIVLGAVYVLCVMHMKLIRMVLAQADFQNFGYIHFALELQFDVM